MTDRVNKVRATSVFRIRHLKQSRIIVAAGGLTPAHLTVITLRGDGGVYCRLDSTGSAISLVCLRDGRTHMFSPGGPCGDSTEASGMLFLCTELEHRKTAERDQISVELRYQSANRNV